MPSKRHARKLIIVVGLTLVGLLILGALLALAWSWQNATRAPGNHNDSRQDGRAGNDASTVLRAVPTAVRAELIRAAVLLENEDLDAAQAAYLALTKTLSDDPLPWQNLLIAETLRHRNRLTELADVRAAADNARQHQADGYVVDYLTASAIGTEAERTTDTARRAALETEADALFAHAAQQDPTRSAADYARYLRRVGNIDPAVAATRLTLINDAYRRDPTNLFLVTARLNELAAVASPELVTAIDNAKPSLAFVRDSILRSPQEIDLFTALDAVVPLWEQATDARDAGNERQANSLALALKARVSIVGNLVRPQDVAQSDRRRLEPYPLEFMKFDSPGLDGSSSIADGNATAPPINYDRDPTLSDGLTALTDGEPVRALRLVDMDQDQTPDVVLVTSRRVIVAKLTTEGKATVELLADYDLAGFEASGLVVADFDRDATTPSRIAVGETEEPVDADPVIGDANPLPCRQADADLLLFGPGGMMLLTNDLRGVTTKRVLTQHPLTISNDADTATSGPGDAVPSVPLELGSIVAVAVLDIEADGDLDLAVADAEGRMRLLLSAGSDRYVDVSRFSQRPPDDFPVTAITAVDFDRDIDLDLVLSGPGGLGVLENLRHGEFRFRPWPVLDDEPSQTIQAVAAHTVVESDGNGSWDVLVVGDEGATLILTATLPGSLPRPVRTVRMPDNRPVSTAKVIPLDANNDGHIDFMATVQRASGTQDSGSDTTTVQDVARGSDLFLQVQANNGDFLTHDLNAEFMPMGAAAKPASDRVPLIPAFDADDLDGDGDLDVVVAHDRVVDVLTADLPEQGKSIRVRLVGREDNVSGRVNTFGLGSTVELREGTRRQAFVADRSVTHFGVGPTPKDTNSKDTNPEDANATRAVRVIWTTGVTQARLNPATDTVLCEEMVLKGSCPFLYTWNGERFVMATDLLWAAPIGLQIAPGVLLPGRSWEYLKISGENCQLKDGHYVLQLTEELWEAAYFDRVRLLAIDHPANIEIFSNEKVGPPSIALPTVHVVKTRLPVRATSTDGEDVTAILAKRDSVYYTGWKMSYRQGVAEEHFLELDLTEHLRGKILPLGARVRLILTGWTYPTDTSLNMAIGQDANLLSPHPPQLLVPNGQDHWRTANDTIGFPGGKPKTIVYDITDDLNLSDPRVRISTNQWLFWDEVFLSLDAIRDVDWPESLIETGLASREANGMTDERTGADSESDQNQHVRVRECTLRSADLHSRGYSHLRERATDQPHWYDYEHVIREPRWAPMDGAFTRFGDVMPLLTTTDDRLVVMAAGDECTLRFDPPADALPEGWVRDFLIYNVGWDKDADLNTIFGQSSEPLPLGGMSSYPPAPGELPHDSMTYSEYLNTYQTRYQNRGQFWRGIGAAETTVGEPINAP